MLSNDKCVRDSAARNWVKNHAKRYVESGLPRDEVSRWVTFVTQFSASLICATTDLDKVFCFKRLCLTQLTNTSSIHSVGSVISFKDEISLFHRVSRFRVVFLDWVPKRDSEFSETGARSSSPEGAKDYGHEESCPCQDRCQDHHEGRQANQIGKG